MAMASALEACSALHHVNDDLAEPVPDDDTWKHPGEFFCASVDVHSCKSASCPCCHKTNNLQPTFIAAPKDDDSPAKLPVMPKKWWAEEGQNETHYVLYAVEEAIAALREFFNGPDEKKTAGQVVKEAP
ncbi:hypothetical protein MPSEU_000708200 [Mayamaea pseudoterrestris]|nr:hypothetical protein MPSEU_000708200 [Mayamaea pseudoterrestris]